METINYYSYEELLTAATKPEATQENIDALGEWFSRFGEMHWNGECYDADGKDLFPVFEWDDELDQGEIVRYEFR